MAINEQQPLLSEKFVHVEDYELRAAAHKRRTEHWKPKRLAWRAILPFLCASAFYGSYVLYQSHRSVDWNAHHRLPPHVDNKSEDSNYTCIPGDSCWPSTTQWTSFNQSINGNLRMTVPWAAPCFSNSSSAECQQIKDSYGNGVSRTAQYGSMEFLDWEECGQSSCFLNPPKSSSLTSGECSLGRLSTYHVEAHSPEDISQTLNFVREHGIRVSIKNTGHDYFGRSNAANSLAIWTHNMKDMKYHKTFQPQGCKAQYDNIGEIGAGIQAQEAWTFFEPLGMLVTVGAVGSVGLAGGFGQGGGHGPLGPKYGLMVDQAVEFDVVTADGQKRTINECSDPDLFWAMRGGGGGNYAVLTSYKFQLHRAVPINVHSLQVNFPTPKDNLITESQVHRDIITALAMNQTLFAENGIAGYNFIFPNHMISLQVMPSTDTQAIKEITAQWHDFFENYSGLDIQENKYYSFEKFSAWHSFTQTPAISRNGAVGLGLAEAGRFIPRDLFASEEDISLLTNAVLTAMEFSLTKRGGGSAQLYATGPVNQPDNSKTGVNPAWRSSLWHVIMGAGWQPGTSASLRRQIQNTISASVQPFKSITPNGGSYMNEGDWMEDNWEQTFFGENYNRLLEVKKKFDPTSLFNCWKCVGWTGYNDPMYSCYTQSHKSPQPSIPLGPIDGNPS